MSRILFVLVLLCVSKIRTKHLTAGFETNSKTFAIILQALGWDASDTVKLTQDQKRSAVSFIYNAFHAFDVATVLRHALPAQGCLGLRLCAASLDRKCGLYTLAQK
eukprot:704272-Amphidinium_carterae.1